MNFTKNVPVNSDHEFKYIFLLALIQFAHMVDFVVLMPLGPTLMTDLSITPVQFGALVSSYNFAAAICGLIFGSFADRYDRKGLMLIALTGFILGTFTCAFADQYIPLLIARMVTGCFGGMMNSLIFAIVSDLVPYERRGKAMGMVMSSFSVASVVGVPIGLAIADASNWSNTFHFIGVFSVFILIATQLIFPNIKDHVSREKVSFFQRVKLLLINKTYLLNFIFIFIVSGSMFLLIPYLSPYAVKNMGMTQDKLKWMYFVGGVFTIGSARFAGVLTDRIGPLKTFAGIVFISFFPVFLFTTSGEVSFIHYLVLGTFFMTMVSARMIPCMTLISKVPDVEDRGFFMSVLHAFRSIGSASMSFVGGLFIIENSQGRLEGFNHAGLMAIAMGLITIIMAFIIAQSLKQKEVMAQV